MLHLTVLTTEVDDGVAWVQRNASLSEIGCLRFARCAGWQASEMDGRRATWEDGFRRCREGLDYYLLPDDPVEALNVLRLAAGLEPLHSDDAD